MCGIHGKDNKMIQTTTDIVGNTGTRFLGGIFTAELVGVVGDMRWMLALITLAVIADLRYGRGESKRRYAEAEAKGDKVGMLQYQWRTSRAIRRTMNKAIDYLVWLLVGMAVGMALLEPIGVSHVFGGVVATAIAVTCEAKSFFGHFFYLHGVNYDETSAKGFLQAVLVSLAKAKSRDLGEALEDGFSSSERDEHKRHKEDADNDR